MNDGKILYDIEVYQNYFCVGIENYVTKQKTFYEISEKQNDIHKIYNYFKTFNGFLISFNGIHYDNMIIKYILQNYSSLNYLEYGDICLTLKYLSDKIIGDDYDDEIKRLKYGKVTWTDIDLFLYWSKMLRMSKKISLKSLGIQLGYNVVQELPYKPDSILTLEDLPKLREYNQIHDLGVLRLLTDKMEDEIKLRGNIVNDYKLNCWSWDAPKIASEALLQDYCKITNQELKSVRDLRFDKPILHLNECLKGFEPNFKLPIFQNLWAEILNSKNSFSKEIVVNINNTSIKLTYGVGGLHSVNENETYESNSDYQVVTSDVALKWRN
jgi:hypothetical protein